MELTSSHTNISTIYLQMEQVLTEHLLKPAEDLKHLKGKERSPHNQVGMKGKMKQAGRIGPASLGDN